MKAEWVQVPPGLKILDSEFLRMTLWRNAHGVRLAEKLLYEPCQVHIECQTLESRPALIMESRRSRLDKVGETFTNQGVLMHPSNHITLENLESAVYWHKPTLEKAAKYERIAKASHEFLKVLLEEAPDCADRSRAISSARDARMLANSAIALDHGEIDHTRGVEQV